MKTIAESGLVRSCPHSKYRQGATCRKTDKNTDDAAVYGFKIFSVLTMDISLRLPCKAKERTAFAILPIGYDKSVVIKAARWCGRTPVW